MSHLSGRGTPYLAFGALAVALGCGTVILNSLGWYYDQEALSLFGQAATLALVSRFYIAQGAAMAAIVVGTYMLYRALLGLRSGTDVPSVAGALADALSSRRNLKIGVAAALIYGVAYAFVSSIAVYQPGVDFGLAYGVTSTSWNAAACCGAPGTVPALILYLAPVSHFALQIVPLTALFAVVVPILVGLNFAVAAHAFRLRKTWSSAKWLSSMGILVGLLTGCPTCAGLFLASAVGGLGATTLAVALAPYQLLFVSVSIPLLLISPVVMAAAVRRSMIEACAVPSRNLGKSEP